MPYYSVHIHGPNAEPVSNKLRDDLRGRNPDYTGHPFFHVKNHRDLAGLKLTVEGMLEDGHTAIVKKIKKAESAWA